jgi:hypothetical protein
VYISLLKEKLIGFRNMKKSIVIFFACVCSYSHAKPLIYKLFDKKKDAPPAPAAPVAYKLGDDPCPRGQHEVSIIKISKLEDAAGKVYEQRENSKSCADNKLLNVIER